MYRFVYLFAFVFLLLLSCGKKESSVQTTPLPRPLKTAKVEALGTISKQYTGIVEADQFSVLAFKVSGTLTELYVRTGQQVRKGDVIARIKPYDYQKQYQSAQANYNAARSIYERNERLFASDAVARQNLEIAEADYVQATSALNIAERTLGYTTLTAPFDGFIERRYVENYEEILAGQSIVRLVNPQNIEIRFVLPENSIRLLEMPKKIYVEFDTRKGLLFTSEIKEYIYSSDGSGIPVTLNITDEQFAPYRPYVFPGFSCKVIFELDNLIGDSYIIPGSAIFRVDNRDYVWVVDPQTSKPVRREVEVTEHKGQYFVEHGLESEDVIVVAGGASLRSE